MRRSQALTLTLASIGFVSLGLPEGLLGVAWPSIRETFGLSLDALGMLLATFAAGYFIASAINGRVLARAGVGTVLSASCALMAACLIGYSLSPSWPMMVALGAGAGAGGGTIDAALNVYATAHGARVLNWLHAAFGLGAAIGPLIMTAILASGGSWSLGYLSLGILQLGLALGYWLLRARFDSPVPQPTEQHHAPPRALLREPIAWLSIGVFAVYVAVEVATGQWTYSLFTLGRGMDPATAGVWVSIYWGSLFVGRLLFGFVVSHMAVNTLMRMCMAAAVLGAALIWLNVPFGLAIVGLVLAPIFPSLIATTPQRVDARLTADLVGLEVAAAVLGGATIPGLVGVLAARVGLEVVGPCLVGLAIVLVALHEVLIRRAFEPRRNAISRTDAVVSSPPGA
jgi:fucose permease